MVKNLLLAGGDRRCGWLARLLAEDGFEVQTIGLRTEDERNVEPQKADALLFPYPFAVRSGCVPTLTGLTLHPEDVLEKARPGIPVIAGRGLEAYLPGDKSFCVKRYMDVETLEQRNADLSAEAVLCEAMQRTERAVMDMRVLIIGYGRFGRALARRMRQLGAEVWAAARREEQRKLALRDGIKAAAIKDIPLLLTDMHMVLNTVPARLLDERALKKIRPDGWLLELASAPYSFDPDAAVALGVNYDVLPGLPARYAPLSAGMALRDAAKKLLEEG